MSTRSTHHATFVIERTYDASPARVFAACSDRAAKAAWFVGPDEWAQGRYEMDFRVGGRERASGGPPGGPVHTYEATFQDIVPDQRIVSTYDMHLDDTRISVSLATLEIAPTGAGTKLVYTEQAVFLDGYDIPADREKGTRDLLDNLGRHLQAEVARS